MSGHSHTMLRFVVPNTGFFGCFPISGMPSDYVL